MSPEEIEKNLKKIDDNFDVVIYRRARWRKRHNNMCSLRYKKEQVMGIRQARTPLYPTNDFGVWDKGTFVRFLSVWEIGKKLKERGFISSHDHRQLMRRA